MSLWNLLVNACTAIGAWFLVAIGAALCWILLRACVDRWRMARCALCRVRCEQLLHCRFGNVCAKCQDAVFRLYHYRAPKLTEEQARKILKNLWRDVEGYEFGGDGWKNG